MNYFEFPEEDGLKPETIELSPGQRAWRLALKLVAVIALLGLVYISGIRPLLLYQRTPAQLQQVPIASTLDAETVSVPLSVFILQGAEGYASRRSPAEVRRLVVNADRIWQQADITLQIVRLAELQLETQEFELFMRTPSTFILNSGVYDTETINVFLVGSLSGINGIAFGGLSSVAVADYTTVFDWRTLAHEIGHVLGLDHVPGNAGRLMYKGANGTSLSLEEIMRARARALEY